MAEFVHKRYQLGKVISDEELVRRLSYQLQIPNRYGKRILTAYREVIKDALANGEGFSIGLGRLRLMQYPQRHYPRGIYQGRKRQTMFKFDVLPTPSGTSLLKDLTYQHFIKAEQEALRDGAKTNEGDE